MNHQELKEAIKALVGQEVVEVTWIYGVGFEAVDEEGGVYPVDVCLQVETDDRVYAWQGTSYCENPDKPITTLFSDPEGYGNEDLSEAVENILADYVYYHAARVTKLSEYQYIERM